MKGKLFTVLLTIGSLQSLVACQTLVPSRRPASVLLRTDSTVIGAHHSGFYYIAKIGFILVNTTPEPISRRGCGGPGWPYLEKKVGDRWVAAYSPVVAACLTLPDWSLPSGATYRGLLDLMAFEPGHNAAPELMVDSIDGIFRLTWGFAQGTDPSVKGVRKVESVSNEFRITLDP
jgi:hypothetical protein